MSRYTATGYIAAGIIYTAAVTRNEDRMTRNAFQGMRGTPSGNVEFIQADGYVAAGIRYTAVHITMYLHNVSLYTGMYQMLSYKSDLAAKGYHNLLWT